MKSKTTKAAKAAKRAPGLALAKPGDPLVTPQGEILQPITHPSKIAQKAVEYKIAPVKFRGKKQHNIKDLPAPANFMHGVGAVLMYSVMNVGDREIADQLGVTVEQVIAIREHEAYQIVFDTFFESVIGAQSESIAGRIAGYAHRATDKIVHLMENAQNEKVMFDASKDILDRGGFRPKDVDQKQGLRNDTLRIQINRADGTQELSVELGVK